MKTALSTLSLILALTTTVQANTYSYNCNYSANPATVVTVDTDLKNETIIGSVQPLDQSLPAIQLSLDYNHDSLFKPAYGKVALVVRDGKASTAVYANPGQTIAMKFESGEIMPGNWGGGPPQTSKFYVVCAPMATTTK